MTYEMFREIVIQRIKMYLSEEWKDAEISRVQYEKVNYAKEAIEFKKKGRDDGEKVCAPNFSVYSFYERHQQGEELDELLHEIAQQVIEADQAVDNVRENLNLEGIKDKIAFELINTEQNKEYLENVPHREYLNLSIVYTWLVGNDEHGTFTATITNSLMKSLEMDEEQLFCVAKDNMKEQMSTVIKPMNEIIDELLGDVCDNEPLDLDIGKENLMYVITNEMRFRGASAILDEEKLHKFAETLGEDFYLLPSSRHEFIAVPASVGDINMLEEMVYEINQTQVEIEDRLSNEVYQYDRQTREIKQVTNSPYKRLDGRMSEADLAYEKECREKSRAGR